MSSSMSHLSNEELSTQKHLLQLINATDNAEDLGTLTTAYGTWCHATRQLSEGLKMRIPPAVVVKDQA